MLYAKGANAADAYAVTVEPAGGSPQPTTKPIAATTV
jgi:anti-sigma-K factor RskA